MQGDSKQFAWELCHSLARSYKINGNSIDKEQLRLFWNQISDQNFDVRLKTFICMLVIYIPFTLFFLFMPISLDYNLH